MLATAACVGRVDLEGTLLDAATGSALADEGVVAVGGGERHSARTDADGRFRIPGLHRDVAYTLVPTDPTWWVARTPAAPARGSIELRARRAPDTDGAWLLDGAELRPLLTGTTLDRGRCGATEIRFPTELPEAPPTLDADTVLVLRGDELAERWRFAPLVPAPPLHLDAPAMDTFAWSYVGVQVRPPCVVQALPAVEPRVTEVRDGAARIRYFDGDALPAGDWVLLRDDGARAFVVRVAGATATPRTADPPRAAPPSP